MRLASAVVLAGLLAGTTVRAAVYSPKTTTCGTVIEVMKSKNKPSMAAVVQMMIDAVYEMDEIAETDGKGSFLDRLTDAEIQQIVATAFLACGGHDSSPAKAAAFSSYTVARKDFTTRSADRN